MPSIKRLLQRMQCKLALLLRPGETPPCKRDLNLPHSPRIEKFDFLPGQLPQDHLHSHEERVRRWREQQHKSRAGPWQMK